MTRKGEWIQTFMGRQFWPLDPRPIDIDILDIAHALSMKCRYSGHCKKFYSVAEHSILVSGNCPEPFKLEGLLHDAAEAYLPDVPRPIKKDLNGFAEIEERIDLIISHKFDLAYPLPEEVKRIDTAILADEQEWLMPNPPADWELSEPKLGIKLNFTWSPEAAERLFLNRFWDLIKKRG